MILWGIIKPVLIVLDKTANVVLELVKFRKPKWETVSARWGRERETNLAAKLGCPVLDVIDLTTDDHCGDAAKSIDEE